MDSVYMVKGLLFRIQLTNEIGTVHGHATEQQCCHSNVVNNAWFVVSMNKLNRRVYPDIMCHNIFVVNREINDDFIKSNR